MEDTASTHDGELSVYTLEHDTQDPAFLLPTICSQSGWAQRRSS